MASVLLSPNQIPARPQVGLSALGASTAGRWTQAASLGLALVFTIMPLAVKGQALPTEPPVARQLLIPSEQIPYLLHGGNERVLLSKDEYARLLRDAELKPVEALPYTMHLVRSQHRIELLEGRADITTMLDFDVLESNWQASRIDLGGAAILSSKIGEATAPLIRGADGFVYFLSSTRGMSQLELRMQAPVTRSQSLQRLSVQLPRANVNRLNVHVRGNVELTAGASVLSRQFDASENVTVFELVATGSSLDLLFSLNNREKQGEQVVLSHAKTFAEVALDAQAAGVHLEVAVLHGELTALEVDLPKGWEATSVTGQTLAAWKVSKEDSQDVLVLTFSEPLQGTHTFHVALLGPGISGTSSWKFPAVVPRQVQSHSALLTLALDPRLTLASAVANGLTPAALRESPAMESQGGNAATAVNTEQGSLVRGQRTVVSYYAPQAEYDLTMQLKRSLQEVDVQSRILVGYWEGSHTLDATLVITPSVEPLFSLDLDIPLGWSPQSITFDGGSPLIWDRSESEDRQRLRLEFPQGMSPATHAIRLLAESQPSTWLSSWDSLVLQAPSIHVRQATNHAGLLGIMSDPSFVQLRMKESSALVPVDESFKAAQGWRDVNTTLCYSFQEANYSLQLHAVRATPQVSAELLTFFHLDPSRTKVHSELIYDVRQASTTKLSFSLPKSTTSAISVKGLNGVGIKQYTSQQKGELSVWTVELAAPAKGETGIAVDYEEPVVHLGESVSLEGPSAADVVYQSGFLAVEADEEMQLEMLSAPKKADIGELFRAEYRPGDRVVDAFKFQGERAVIALKATHSASLGLPTTLLEKVEYVTQWGPRGSMQTAARFKISTKEPALLFAMPEDSQLWSATINGKPSQPQARAGMIQLDVGTAGADAHKEVVLIYETATPHVDLFGAVKLAPVRILVGSKEGSPLEAYSADGVWSLYSPAQYEVIGGPFSEEAAWRDGLAPWRSIAWTANWITGGIHFPKWLKGPQQYGVNAPASRADSPAASEDKTFSYDDAPRTAAEPSPPAMDAPLSKELELAESGAEASSLSDAPQVAQAGKPMEMPLDRSSKRRGLSDVWAIEAFRSLNIALQTQGAPYTLKTLSVQDAPSIQVIHAIRWRFVSLALAAALTALGLLLTNATWYRKVAFLFTLLGMALLAPQLVAGKYWIASLASYACGAAVLLAFWYCFVQIPAAQGAARRPGRAWRRVGMGLLLFTSCLDVGAKAQAQQPTPVPPTPRINIPKDVVIIPYDSTKPGVRTEDSVLVDYDLYTALWKQSHPEQAVAPPPVNWAIHSTRYEAALKNEDVVHIRGILEYENLTEELVELPLTILGGVLSGATVDGQPAHLRVVEVRATENSQGNSTAAQTSPVLQLRGKGKKVVQLQLQFPVVREGGWHVVSGELPLAIQSAVSLIVEESQTELKLEGFSDAGIDATLAEQQKIETSILGRSFRMRWRSLVKRGAVDQGLSAASDVLWVVREGASMALWNTLLTFKQSERDAFRFFIPADYRVERVEGENIRAWRQTPEETGVRVDVELLSAARDSARLQLRLARHGLKDSITLQAPLVQVDGAVLQQGSLLLAKEKGLNIRVDEQRGLARASASEMPPGTGLNPVFDFGPSEAKPFQAFKFNAVPFELVVTATKPSANNASKVTGIVRLLTRQAQFEGQVEVTPKNAPLHQFTIEHSGDMKLNRVVLSAPGDWSTEQEDGKGVLHVILKEPALAPVTVTFSGSIDRLVSSASLALPAITVLNSTQSAGQYVIQADADFDVAAEELEGYRSVSIDSCYPWLREEQRPLARLALSFEGAAPSGKIRLIPRTPVATLRSFSNVQVQPSGMRETVLLDFHIEQAGVSEIQFTLPRRFDRARVSVPLLREKVVEEAEGNEAASQFTLRFQDSILGDLRVLVELDRLAPEGNENAAIPEINSAASPPDVPSVPVQVKARYVLLENKSEAELAIEDPLGMTKVTNAERAWKELVEVFGGGLQHAYLVNSGANTPRLSFRLASRERVETAGASIGLAETHVTMDAWGEYRARQIYKVDNRTEQFLVCELPEQANLWSALVKGRPVKPLPDVQPSGQRFRIPIPKTAQGEDDFPVEIVYAGRLPSMGLWGAAAVPIARCANIPVEKSQLRLWLPESHLHSWFDGSMRKAESEDELTEDYLSYQEKRIDEMSRALEQGGENDFVKLRVDVQLKQLRQEAEMLGKKIAVGNSAANKQAVEKLQGNLQALDALDTRLKAANGTSAKAGETAYTNDSRLQEFYGMQQAQSGRNSLVNAESNFSYALPNAPEGKTNQPSKDEKLAENLRGDVKRAGKDFAKKLAEEQVRQLEAGVVENEVLTDAPFYDGAAGEGKQKSLASSDDVQTSASPMRGGLDYPAGGYPGGARGYYPRERRQPRMRAGGLGGGGGVGGGGFGGGGFGGAIPPEAREKYADQLSTDKEGAPQGPGATPANGPAIASEPQVQQPALPNAPASPSTELSTEELDRAQADANDSVRNGDTTRFRQEVEERVLHEEGQNEGRLNGRALARDEYWQELQADRSKWSEVELGVGAKQDVDADVKFGRARGESSIGPTTGLASLDIDIPQRGQVFYFTTPRGEAFVTFSFLQKRLVYRAAFSVTAIVGLFVAYGVLRFLQRTVDWKELRAFARRSIATPLMAIVMMICGVLPVLGGLIFIWFVMARLAHARNAMHVLEK